MWIRKLTLLTTLLTPVWSIAADAGDRDAGSDHPDENAAARMPTILIAPEWRSIDAQRTARTVEHFSAERLDAGGTHNSIDLQYLTPGFVFKTNAVLGQPYLRGVGSDIISAGAESSVATFVDGVYLPRAFDTIVDFFDIDHVEVLKGPQGVHMGRNVVGGAVSVHTRDPEPRHGGYADVLLGNYNQRQLRGAVNVPLGPDLAVRVAGIVSRRDGYVDNVFLNVDENDENHYAVRGKLLYRPTDAFSVLLSAEHRSEDSSRALGSQPRADIGRNGGIELGGSVPDNPRQVTENVAPEINVSSNRYSARLSWRNDAIELTSTTAYLTTEGRLALDLDGTDVDYAANYPAADSESMQQEFRLASPQDLTWSWVGGVFLLRENSDQLLDVRLPLSGIRNVPDGSVETRSQAVFGQLAWRFRPDWRSRLGLRYSRDKRALDLVRTLSTPAGTTITRQIEHGRWHAFTPEFGLEYAPDRDRLYYATVSRGYKPGGYNTSVIQPAFDAEDLWAYEAGVKLTFPQRRLRLNAALFHYDYRDMQLTTLPPDAPAGSFPSVMNAAESTIRGLDLDLLYQPRWDTDITLGMTLLDARFDEFASVDRNNPTVDADRADNRLPQAPEVSLNLRADRRWPVTYGTLTFGGELRYQTEIYFNAYQDPAVRQGGYGLLNTHVTFESHKRDWYAELYGRNLTDKLYAQTIVRDDPRTGTKRHWGAPRTVGLRMGYRW